MMNRLDLLATLHILIVSLTPTNYVDLIYSICCEVIPIQLLLLLVYNFDINSYKLTFSTRLSLELYNLTLTLSLQKRLPSLWMQTFWLATLSLTMPTLVKMLRIWWLLLLEVIRIVKLILQSVIPLAIVFRVGYGRWMRLWLWLVGEQYNSMDRSPEECMESPPTI